MKTYPLSKKNPYTPPRYPFRLLLLAAFLLFASLLPSSLYAENVTFTYNGEMIDQKATPISALLPLTFKVYKTPKATSPVVSRSAFVSVINGRYAVDLSLPASLQNFYLAVVWNKTELFRQPLSLPEPVKNQPSADNAHQQPASDSALLEWDSFTLECPENAVMTGIQVFTDAGKKRVALKCKPGAEIASQ